MAQCKICKTYITDDSKDGLCLWCRSEQLKPCEHFYWKELSISVPWCEKFDKRVLTKNGFMCNTCKYSSEPKEK